MRSRLHWRPPQPRGRVGEKGSLPDLGHEELALLLSLGERLVSELDLDNVLAMVAETACEVVQAETLVVPVIEPDQQKFTYRAASGKYAAMILGQTFPIHEGACGWVIKHQRPLLFGEGGSFELDASAQWQPGMASSLLVPLICRGVITGGLSAMGKRGGGAFNQRDLTVMTLFANQASIAIDNARLFKTLDSERKRLDTILRTASDGIHIVDGDGMLIEANDAFLKMLGHDKTAIGYLHVGDWDVQDTWEVIRERNNVLIDTKGTAVFETRHKRRDGKTLDVEISACGIELEGKRFLYAASRDITERKLQRQQIKDLNIHLEERVRQRTEELARANTELEAFSYSISHDLRAPLRALDGFAHLLHEEEANHLSPDGRHMLERIWINAGKMGVLIDDILQFSRVGRYELQRADTNMTELARSVAGELLPEYPQADVRVAELPRVRGDASMLRQVWANLIGNALKFSSKTESPHIDVGTADSQGDAIFFVRDNGAGFDMTHADKLFNVFQRMHSEKDFPGTGAGLAIVKRIVERHGGRIWAEARPNCGATFYFTLGGDSSSVG